MHIDLKLKDVKHLIIRSSIETKSYYQQVVFYMQFPMTFGGVVKKQLF